MAVAHREEVAVSQSQEVRTRDVRILIDLVGVVNRETCLRGERELGHHIRYLWLLFGVRVLVGLLSLESARESLILRLVPLMRLLLSRVSLKLLFEFSELAALLEWRQITGVVQVHLLNALEALRVRGSRGRGDTLQKMLLQ